MLKDTLTLALEGDIALEDFAKAMRHFRELVDSLSSEMSPKATVEWVIAELHAASAIATVQGACDVEGTVSRIVDAYGQVGDALSTGEEIPFSYPVQKHATALTDILDDRITSIRFETVDHDVLISTRATPGQRPRPLRYAFGTVKGTVQMLTMRGKLKFTLYDAVFDRAVSCYLQEGQEEEMRSAWGRRTTVTGTVGREPEHGRPVVVRDITNIAILPEVEPGSYRRARGLVPWKEGDEPPETTIRRLREAE